MKEPGKVIVAGDLHGNSFWAEHVIREAGKLLKDEEQPTILQLGDFGVWSGTAGDIYLKNVARASAKHKVRTRFIDGNHEDFTRIGSLRIDESNPDRGWLKWLPRGYRWTWHGRTWLALGGAVSVDKAVRKEGHDWWPDEEITDEQAAQVVADGHADVMLTHDCPAGVVHSFDVPPSFWDARDLARSDVHREKLQGIVDAVQPSYLAHGHLHRAYQRVQDFGYGPVEITGLDMDGSMWNYMMLDTETMEWHRPEEIPA